MQGFNRVTVSLRISILLNILLMLINSFLILYLKMLIIFTRSHQWFNSWNLLILTSLIRPSNKVYFSLSEVFKQDMLTWVRRRDAESILDRYLFGSNSGAIGFRHKLWVKCYPEIVVALILSLRALNVS